MTTIIRAMTVEDYDQLHALWMRIKGFGIRSIDDSKEGVERFLKRNPTTSVIAEIDGKVVGGILCGHDGSHGIGKSMVAYAMSALKEEHINKITLIAFTKNDIGNTFWNTIGWTKRPDVNYYEFVLNEENITAFIEEG